MIEQGNILKYFVHNDLKGHFYDIQPIELFVTASVDYWDLVSKVNTVNYMLRILQETYGDIFPELIDEIPHYMYPEVFPIGVHKD